MAINNQGGQAPFELSLIPVNAVSSLLPKLFNNSEFLSSLDLRDSQECYSPKLRF